MARTQLAQLRLTPARGAPYSSGRRASWDSLLSRLSSRDSLLPSALRPPPTMKASGRVSCRHQNTIMYRLADVGMRTTTRNHGSAPKEKCYSISVMLGFFQRVATYCVYFATRMSLCLSAVTRVLGNARTSFCLNVLRPHARFGLLRTCPLNCVTVFAYLSREFGPRRGSCFRRLGITGWTRDVMRSPGAVQMAASC